MNVSVFAPKNSPYGSEHLYNAFEFALLQRCLKTSKKITIRLFILSIDSSIKF